MSSVDDSKLKSTQDIGKYADSITNALSTAVDKAISTFKSERSESQPISAEAVEPIKYPQVHAHLVKTRINHLPKEIKDNNRKKSQVSWEKFYNLA